jgi:hypothetical protein
LESPAVILAGRLIVGLKIAIVIPRNSHPPAVAKAALGRNLLRRSGAAA